MLRTVVRLPDGRDLDVLDAGDPKGRAVFVHNGTPSGVGLYAPHVADAERRRLRLVNCGRPGYGRSTRQPGRSVAQAAADTAAVADHLGIERFATWGISGGGPHALACAALLPERVVAAASLAGVAPYGAPGLDFMAGMGDDNLVEFGAALEGEAALAPVLEGQVPAMLAASAPEMVGHMRSLLSAVDQAVFTGELGEYLVTLLQDAVRTGTAGWLDDDLAFAAPWGFSPEGIRVPVQIWQGTHDQFVPRAHGEWLAAHTPRAQAHISPDDGHLTLLARRVPEVHAWLAEHF